MQTINKISLIALILSILIPTACSVKKRVYLSGYHVEWFKNKKQSNIASVNKKLNKDAEQPASMQKNYFGAKKLTTSHTQEKNDLMASATNSEVVFFEKTKTKKIIINAKKSSLILYKDLQTKQPLGLQTSIEKKFDRNDPNKALFPENKTSDKSMTIAVLLWFFLGILGIHRFYLGHMGIGILYLLTGALCGIGWLVDGVLFLTGDLKPKDGEFKD